MNLLCFILMNMSSFPLTCNLFEFKLERKYKTLKQLSLSLLLAVHSDQKSCHPLHLINIYNFKIKLDNKILKF